MRSEDYERAVIEAVANALERWFNETPDAGAEWTWKAAAEIAVDAARDRERELHAGSAPVVLALNWPPKECGRLLQRLPERVLPRARLLG